MARLTERERCDIKHRQQWLREWYAIRGRRAFERDDLLDYESTLIAEEERSAKLEAERDAALAQVAERDDLLREAREWISDDAKEYPRAETLIAKIDAALGDS